MSRSAYVQETEQVIKEYQKGSMRFLSDYFVVSGGDSCQNNACLFHLPDEETQTQTASVSILTISFKNFAFQIKLVPDTDTQPATAHRHETKSHHPSRIMLMSIAQEEAAEASLYGHCPGN